MYWQWQPILPSSLQHTQMRPVNFAIEREEDAYMLTMFKLLKIALQLIGLNESPTPSYGIETSNKTNIRSNRPRTTIKYEQIIRFEYDLNFVCSRDCRWCAIGPVSVTLNILRMQTTNQKRCHIRSSTCAKRQLNQKLRKSFDF